MPRINGTEGAALFGSRRGAFVTRFSLFKRGVGEQAVWEGQIRTARVDDYLMEHADGGELRLRLGSDCLVLPDPTFRRDGSSGFTFTGSGETRMEPWETS